MNIILFRADEVELPLPRTDPRASHILNVLRCRPDDSFDAGLINGPRGRGKLVAITADALNLSFGWDEAPSATDALHLLIGLPRPQTARDILRDATTLGVAALHFVRTEKGEAGYTRSKLWHTGEWERLVIAGAEQAFCTRLPVVTHGRSLEESVSSLPENAIRLALDNYEASAALASCDLSGLPAAVLAVGGERGWSEKERVQLRTAGFALVHLGPRVLRTETACIAAITLIKARRNWL